MIKYICNYCGRECLTPYAWYKKMNNHYCSRKCYADSRRDKKPHNFGKVKNEKFYLENMNKHVCSCGCGKIIKIQTNHIKRGIPKFIRGHSSRINNPMSGKRGVNNPNYKGRKKLRTALGQSKEYIKWRSEIFKRDSYKCVKCGKSNCILSAHHIKTFSDIANRMAIYTLNDAIECDELWKIDNGETLCENCHKKTTSYGKKFKQGIAYPLGEVFDRYTISTLKMERIPKEREMLRIENDVYKREIKNLNLDEKLKQDFVDRLYRANEGIWNLESQIRSNQLKGISLEEVGRRAIAIRELNKRRVAIKNEIVETTNTGFLDVKMNHASE